jgi:hypothetical protein
MLISLVWYLALSVTGGFYWEPFGIRMSSRDPMRPLVAAIAFALTFWYLAPETVDAFATRLELEINRKAVLLAIGTAAVTSIVGLIYSTNVAGGADAYGYVSQADLWLTGHLIIDQRSLLSPAWPFDDWPLSPLGYRPGPEAHTIVPTYSPGLPLLMATAKLLMGASGPFYVVPLLGGLAVFLTFLLGRRLFDNRVGVAAALLLAASPGFLFMLMTPMSDVPAATAWALALVLAISGRPLAAGLASGFAIAIRPNTALLGLAVGLITLQSDSLNESRWRAAKRTALVLIGVIPGVLGIALLNRHLYGAALTSGYGKLADIYSWGFLGPNLARYPRWLVETQTPFILASILPLVSRRFVLPGTLSEQWPVRFSVALFLTLLLASYVFYLPFDAWWFLRFLLPGYPVLLVLAAGLARGARPGVGRTSQVILMITVVMLVFARELSIAQVRGVFNQRTGEQRYVTVGRELAATTPSNAVFLAMMHSGALRYYSGRLSVRYDQLPPESLDAAIDALRNRGFRPYFLLDDWEVPRFRERFSEKSRAGKLDWPPRTRWHYPIEVELYDPSDLPSR